MAENAASSERTNFTPIRRKHEDCSSTPQLFRWKNNSYSFGYDMTRSYNGDEQSYRRIPMTENLFECDRNNSSRKPRVIFSEYNNPELVKIYEEDRGLYFCASCDKDGVKVCGMIKSHHFYAPHIHTSGCNPFVKSIVVKAIKTTHGGRPKKGQPDVICLDDDECSNVAQDGSRSSSPEIVVDENDIPSPKIKTICMDEITIDDEETPPILVKEVNIDCRKQVSTDDDETPPRLVKEGDIASRKPTDESVFETPLRKIASRKRLPSVETVLESPSCKISKMNLTAKDTVKVDEEALLSDSDSKEHDGQSENVAEDHYPELGSVASSNDQELAVNDGDTVTIDEKASSNTEEHEEMKTSSPEATPTPPIQWYNFCHPSTKWLQNACGKLGLSTQHYLNAYKFWSNIIIRRFKETFEPRDVQVVKTGKNSVYRALSFLISGEEDEHKIRQTIKEYFYENFKLLGVIAGHDFSLLTHESPIIKESILSEGMTPILWETVAKLLQCRIGIFIEYEKERYPELVKYGNWMNQNDDEIITLLFVEEEGNYSLVKTFYDCR